MTTNRFTHSESVALATAAALTVAGDYLFWPAWPGVALGVFVLLAAAALCWNRRGRWNRNSFIAILLLLPTAAQTGIEQSFSNFLALVLLLLVLFGETSFPVLRAGWARWSEALIACCETFAGWGWLRNFAGRIPSEREQLHHRAGNFLRIAFPAVALGLVFLLLLGFGNAIFAHWISYLLSRPWQWLMSCAAMCE